MGKWHFVFDTETTGLPARISRDLYFDYTDVEKYNKSRLVSISWILFNSESHDNPIMGDYLIKPDGFVIHNSHFHGISHLTAEKEGITIKQLAKILGDLFKTHPVSTIVGHNLLFDLHILASEFHRYGQKKLAQELMSLNRYCTMEETRELLKLTPQKGGRWKPPKLEELHQYFFKKPVENAHQSHADVWATYLCYLELLK